MIRAEIRKYLWTKSFLTLNLLGLALLGAWTLLLLGMDRIGLRAFTSYDYLTESFNLYISTLLPLLACLFAAYAFSSEYQWRTLMVPIFEGVSRLRIIWGKVVLCISSVLAISFFYLIFSLPPAFALFPIEDGLLEGVMVSPAAMAARLAGAALWQSMTIVPFCLLAMVIAVRSRQQILAGLGAFLLFITACLLPQGRYNPLSALFLVPEVLLGYGDLGGGQIWSLVLKGLGIQAILSGLALTLLAAVFMRRDIILD